MQSSEIDTITEQANGLPREKKVELIRYLTETISADKRDSIPLK